MLGPDVMPKEYGGRLPLSNYLAEVWNKQVHSYADMFIERQEDLIAIDEKKKFKKAGDDG